jgi:hypothetical protein
MLRDYIIFLAACCPTRALQLHVRLMPQEDYDKIVPERLCDKAALVLAQPKMVTFEVARELHTKLTSDLREERRLRG